MISVDRLRSVVVVELPEADQLTGAAARAINEHLDRCSGADAAILCRASSMTLIGDALPVLVSQALRSFAIVGVAGSRFDPDTNFTSGSPFLHWRLDVGQHHWKEAGQLQSRVYGPAGSACAALHPDLLVIDPAAVGDLRLATDLCFDLAVIEYGARVRKRGLRLGVWCIPHEARQEPRSWRALEPDESKRMLTSIRGGHDKELELIPVVFAHRLLEMGEDFLTEKEVDFSGRLSRDYPRIRWDSAEELLLHHAEMKSFRANSSPRARSPSRPYVVVGPRYDASSGGAVALHLLCEELRRAGQEAYLFAGRQQNARSTYLGSPYDVRIAPVLRDLIEEAIVLYPEVVLGNPLRASRVCRWLLNRPGVLGGDGRFGRDDLVFHYQESFVHPGRRSETLWVFDLHTELYNDLGAADRRGTCYTVRKRKGFPLVHDLTDSIEVVDSSPRVELADLFRTRLRFYSYDLHTFLSTQAAMAGCLSIVIPLEGLSGDQWREGQEMCRYGVAYGEDEIPRALETRPLLMPHVQSMVDRGRKTVESFIEITQANWA